VGVLRARWWLILLAACALPGIAILFSVRQTELYEASADVLVKTQTLASTISGIAEPWQDPVRFMETQVDLARVPEVTRRTLDAVGLSGRTTQSLLDRSDVTPKAASDVLTFRVTEGTRDTAVRLATAYAEQYTEYRQELDTEAVGNALREVEQRIAELDTPAKTSPLFDSYASLVDRREQLRTLEVLLASNASVVRPASTATKIQPKPVRNALVGLGLGIILGIGLAFLRQALDTRVRSGEEVGTALGLHLLARIPPGPRRARRKGGIAMLEDTHGVVAEATRVLRMNLEFMNLELGARRIMVTSAVQGEGKSTTAANLAVAIARSGRAVILVDLDLRRPRLAELFGLEGRSGLTDVVLGHAALEDALASIPVGPALETPAFGNGSGSVAPEAPLEVLPSGPVPPNPSEFVGSAAVGALIESLTERADVVLIDAPPLFGVSDALVLSGKVDALMLLVRLTSLRRRSLGELHRVLARCPVAKLGFVQTGAAKGEEFDDEQAYYYYRSPPGARREGVGHN
jgi:capsular exopolysaccharide synthesis family protein